MFLNAFYYIDSQSSLTAVMHQTCIWRVFRIVTRDQLLWVPSWFPL